MQRLRGWLRFWFRLVLTYVLIMAAVTAFFAFAPAVWSPPLIQWLEESAQTRAQTKIKISHLYFSKFWPITLRLANVEVQKAPLPIKGQLRAVDLSFASERVDANWLRPRSILSISLVDPNLSVELPPEPTATEAQSAESSDTVMAIMNPSKMERPRFLDLDLAFAIQRGKVQILGRPYLMELNDLNFHIRMPSLRSELWHPLLKIDVDVRTNKWGVDLTVPVELEVAQSTVAEDAFKIEKLRFSVAKLNFTGKGFYHWQGDYDLMVDLKTADVATLPPSFLPEGKWRGLFSGSARLQRGLEQPRKLTLNLESQNLVGDVKFKRPQGEVEGEVSAQARVKLEMTKTLSVDDSSVLIDFTKARVAYGTYFLKEPGLDMSVLINGDAQNDVFQLRRAQVRVAHVRMNALGEANLGKGGKGRFQASLSPTTISGLEKLIPPIRNSPVQGVISGEAVASGDMGHFEEWVYELKNLNVMGLRGRLDYGSGDITIQGPITGQMNLRGQAKGAEFEFGTWDFTGDLSDLAVTVGSKFKKPTGWSVKMATTGKAVGRQIVVEKMRLVGEGGDVQVKGSFTFDKEVVPVNLTMNMSPLKISSWLRLMPVADLRAAGEVSGQLSLNGKWVNAEGLATTPLQLNAQLVLKDGDIVYLPPPAVASKVPKEKMNMTSKAQVVEALLPNWPLIRTAKVNLDSGFKQIVFSDLTLKGVTHVGQWLGGQWKGTASLENVFSGTMQVSHVVISPLASPPSFELQSSFQGLHANQVVEWIKPKLKGYMEGRLSGEVNAIGALPLADVGYSQIKADGDVTMAQAVLKTVNLDELINKELKKFGVGSAQVKNSPLPFAASTKFAFQDSQLNLEKFRLVTARRDELGLRGLIDTDLQADLTGNIALSGTRLSGSIAKANADSQGRLVVPMQIKGSLLNPNFSITDSTIATMLTKTVEFEAKKLMKDLEKGGGDKAKDEIKKRLKKAFGR